MQQGSLVFFKNKAAVASPDGDRIELALEGGGSARVREKDVEVLHPGPVKTVPAPRSGGDFETAWQMTSGSPVALKDLCELVFGDYDPAGALACRLAALAGELFRQEGEGILSLGADERERLAEKRRQKAAEGDERSAFLERARKGGREAGDERFLGEIEAFALGKSPKSRLASELGCGEDPEAAHAFLLRSGAWSSAVNPWPSRAEHPSKAPVLPLGPDDDANRRDLTAMRALAIDNAWSHDPDDAIGWDGASVWIHIADPASVILPDTEADAEACNRSNTLYLPEGAIPMLPDAALERFGLGLSETSRALSFRVRIDGTGLIAEAEVMPSFVRVERHSYESADALLSGAAADDGKPDPLMEALALVAETRRGYREGNGAVDIDIPEVRVFVREGVPEIAPLPETRSSGIVREFMVLGGEAAARIAFENRVPFPYYSQEAPGERSGLPEGLAGEFAKRRLMRGGMAGSQPRAHQGLGVSFYAQATSPLRRYADLLAHQQLRAWLAGRKPLDDDGLSMRLARSGAQSARVRKAERSSVLHWTLVWLMNRPGWTGRGIVVGTGPESAVYLPEIGLETRVRKSGLEPNAELRMRFLNADPASQDARFAPED